MSLMSPKRYYVDKMSPDEVSFLKRRLVDERRKFGKAYKNTMIATIIVVLILASVMYAMHVLDPKKPNDEHTVEITAALIMEVVGYGFLTILSMMSLIFGYLFYKNVFLLSKDVRRMDKIVEQANIVGKKYMPHNDTYHLTLDSPKRYSMEVDHEFYNNYHIGDEINLEYAKHSLIDFGYF